MLKHTPVSAYSRAPFGPKATPPARTAPVSADVGDRPLEPQASLTKDAGGPVRIRLGGLVTNGEF